MIDPRIHVGETHGIYYIVDVLPEKDKYGHWIYDCICTECGFHKYSHYGAIAGEKSVANVCNHLRANGEYITYGHIWNNKRIGKIFKGMLQRCYNQNEKSYRWYGGKGIKVCDEWINDPECFEKWALNNGYSDNLTIDRIDENKDYCPENCQWISLEENTRKAGNVTWITIGNETLTGRQWSEKIGFGIMTVNKYIIKYGIDLTIELIKKMLADNPRTKHRKSHQSWFDVYGIDTTKLL